MSDETPPQPPAIFRGFSPRQRLWILGVATALAIAIVGYTSYVAFDAASTIPFGDKDYELLGSVISSSKDGPGAVAIHTRTVEAFAHGRSIASRLTLGYLGVGSGIALMWLGFALSVLGADGAFQIAAESEKKTLRFGGTTPGILALGLGAALVAIGATRSFELDFGELEVGPPAASVGERGGNAGEGSKAVDGADEGQSKALSDEELDKLTKHEEQAANESRSNEGAP